MDNNKDMRCDQCEVIFQSLSKVHSLIKTCPACEEKSQATMLDIMWWTGWDTLMQDDEESITTRCQPPFNVGLYALLDKVLNKVVVVISQSYEGAYCRRNGNWMDLSDEDYRGAMVIDVDSTFIAIYDEAESFNKTIGMDRVKEHMVKKVD